MPEIEDALVDSFLARLAVGEVHLPYSDGISWAYLRHVKLGYNIDVELPKKKLDLLLVEMKGFDSNWIYGYDIAIASGFKLTGRSLDNIAEMLGRLDGNRVWIVEAKDSRKNLWGALGQAFFYRALLFNDRPNLNIVGSVIVYPENFGRDEIIEGAIQVVRRSLGIEICIEPTPINGGGRKGGGKPAGGLDDFL